MPEMKEEEIKEGVPNPYFLNAAFKECIEFTTSKRDDKTISLTLYDSADLLMEYPLPPQNESESPENKVKRAKFDKQFRVLVTQLQKWGLDNEEKEASDTLSSFPDHFFSEIMTGTQTSFYFAQIKQFLEDILFALKDEKIPSRLRKNVYVRLCNTIKVCGPGIGEHCENALKDLTNLSTSLTNILAIIRTDIINRLASRYILENKIAAGSEIHVQAGYLNYAKKIGLEPLRKIDEKKLSDPFTALVGLSDTHENSEERKKAIERLNIFKDQFVNCYKNEIIDLLEADFSSRYYKRFNELPKKIQDNGFDPTENSQFMYDINQLQIEIFGETLFNFFDVDIKDLMHYNPLKFKLAFLSGDRQKKLSDKTKVLKSEHWQTIPLTEYLPYNEFKGLNEHRLYCWDHQYQYAWMENNLNEIVPLRDMSHEALALLFKKLPTSELPYFFQSFQESNLLEVKKISETLLYEIYVGNVNYTDIELLLSDNIKKGIKKASTTIHTQTEKFKTLSAEIVEKITNQQLDYHKIKSHSSAELKKEIFSLVIEKNYGGVLHHLLSSEPVLIEDLIIKALQNNKFNIIREIISPKYSFNPNFKNNLFLHAMKDALNHRYFECMKEFYYSEDKINPLIILAGCKEAIAANYSGVSKILEFFYEISIMNRIEIEKAYRDHVIERNCHHSLEFIYSKIDKRTINSDFIHVASRNQKNLVGAFLSLKCEDKNILNEAVIHEAFWVVMYKNLEESLYVIAQSGKLNSTLIMDEFKKVIRERTADSFRLENKLAQLITSKYIPERLKKEALEWAIRENNIHAVKQFESIPNLWEYGIEVAIRLNRDNCNVLSFFLKRLHSIKSISLLEKYFEAAILNNYTHSVRTFLSATTLQAKKADFVSIRILTDADKLKGFNKAILLDNREMIQAFIDEFNLTESGRKMLKGKYALSLQSYRLKEKKEEKAEKKVIEEKENILRINWLAASWTPRHEVVTIKSNVHKVLAISQKNTSIPAWKYFQNVEKCLRDPFTHEFMIDPIVFLDGLSYERENIATWHRLFGCIDPNTGINLFLSDRFTLIADHDLRSVIEAYKTIKKELTSETNEKIEMEFKNLYSGKTTEQLLKEHFASITSHKSYEPLKKQGEILYQCGHFKEAIAIYKKAKKLFPVEGTKLYPQIANDCSLYLAKAYNALAVTYTKPEKIKNKYEKALRYINENKNVNSGESYYEAAVAYIGLKNSDKALQILNLISTEILNSTPEMWDLVYKVSQLYLKLNEPVKALHFLDLVSVTSMAVPADICSKICYQKGLIYFNNGSFNEAILSFTESLTFNSYDNLKAYFQRALAYNKIKKWHLAEKDFLFCIKNQYKQNALFIFQYGLALKEQGFLEKALDCFKQIFDVSADLPAYSLYNETLALREKRHKELLRLLRNEASEITEGKEEKIAEKMEPVKSLASYFICPITKKVIHHPVIGSDNCTYEKEAYEIWISLFENEAFNPVTEERLNPNFPITVNESMKDELDSARRKIPLKEIKADTLKNSQKKEINLRLHCYTIYLERKKDATVYDNNGLFFLGLRDFENAAFCFKNAITLKPEIQTQTYLILARLLQRGEIKGHLIDALKNVNESLKLTVTPHQLEKQGEILLQLGRANEALISFNKSINETSRLPERHSLFYNRGRCFLQLNQYEDALKEFNSIPSTSVVGGCARYQEGLLLDTHFHRHPEEILSYYRKALEHEKGMLTETSLDKTAVQTKIEALQIKLKSQITIRGVCPITEKLIQDPILGNDGHYYEKAALQQWCRLFPNLISPKTGKSLSLGADQLPYSRPNDDFVETLKATVFAPHDSKEIKTEEKLSVKEQENHLVLQCCNRMLSFCNANPQLKYHIAEKLYSLQKEERAIILINEVLSEIGSTSPVLQSCATYRLKEYQLRKSQSENESNKFFNSARFF